MNRLALAAAALIAGSLFTVLIAGPLNPPAGPVSSTYKTLNEVEPRIPISTSTTPPSATGSYRITQPGSYYLTSNITGEANKNGIEIASSGVSIDLRGFALIGVASSLDGIASFTATPNAIAITNGSVRGWGGDGIDLNSNLTDAARITDISASANTGNGIRGGRTVIINCAASNNGGDGIASGSGSVISHCSSVSNTGSGIVCSSVETVVSECSSRLNGQDGIIAAGGCIILNNSSGSNGQATTTGANIRVNNADNRLEGNNCSSCDQGIVVAGTGNLILRNSCSGNATNWVIAANNYYGPIIDRQSIATPAVNGSSAASTLATTEPNANFTY